MKQAEQVYLETLNSPQVKSLEVAGFSMGSMFANHLAARFGAQSTVMADLGISDSAMKRDFNARARTQPENAIFANYSLNQMNQEMRRNVVTLSLGFDILPKIFAVGQRRGREIDLDPNEADTSGIRHSVSIYRENAAKLDYNRPDTRAAGLTPAFRPALA
jgi:predicted alpha/beta-fold hydrolase